MFSPKFQRTHTERIDQAQAFFGAQVHNESNKLPEHKDRMVAHCERITEHPKGLSGNINREDLLHVRAFHAVYKLLKDKTHEERLLIAICATSDDIFKKADKAKIKEWDLRYRGRLRKNG